VFEWDEAKRQRNLAEHGIDFADVLEAFAKPARVEFADTRCDYGELRSVLLVPMRGRLLHITWTWRGRARRLISARKANAREQQRYARYWSDDPGGPHR
jgi:uncharacterized DUF497 family protein